MSTSLKLVKDLTNMEPTIYQILTSFILGNASLTFHNEETIYNKADIVVKMNDETNQLEVFQCLEDYVLGEFNPEQWEQFSFNDYRTVEGSKLISFSDQIPENNNNVIWCKPTETKTINIPISIL